MKAVKVIFGLAFLPAMLSCTEILDVQTPSNELAEEEALNSKQDFLEVLNSCYDVNANIFNGRVQYCHELLSDNLSMQNVSGDLGQIYNRNVSIFNGTVDAIYTDHYRGIFRANRLDEVLGNFGFSAQEALEIRAELSFLRALLHWEALKLWAQPYGYSTINDHSGIVYKTSTAVEVLARATVAENYRSIIADLQDALASGGLPLSAPYRASEDAARHLLAEVYFQKGDYDNALAQAEAVINGERYQLDTLIDRFQPDSVQVPEVIFKTRSYAPTQDYRSFAFTSNYRTDVPQLPFLRASPDFWQSYQSDTNDRRVVNFFQVFDAGGPDEYVGVNKFNKVYFDVPIFHLTDLRLLRAECLVYLDRELSTAIGDVNAIRERAFGDQSRNLPKSAPPNTILEAIHRERRIELFGEGDRVQQLKRRGALHSASHGPVLIRGVDWNCAGMILQFPAVERTELFEINPQGGC